MEEQKEIAMTLNQLFLLMEFLPDGVSLEISLEKERMKNAHELEVVSIRLVDEPPLLSEKLIKTSRDVIEVMGEHLQKYDRELFCILNLRTKGQVINMNIVSMGTLNLSLVHPREVFKSAILSNAAGIILLHNHPSGAKRL